MIGVVDYGVGNVSALVNMLDYIGHEGHLVSDSKGISASDKLILPGVGSFDHAMMQLDAFGLRKSLIHAGTVRRIPILGVCLGMQLLGLWSEEGRLAGLQLIDAQSRRLRPVGSRLKVPNMGWSDVTPIRSSPLFPQEHKDERFYFAHSYYVECNKSNLVVATIDYGSQTCVAFQEDNIFGVQFHPEKSHRFGVGLMKNFAEL